MNLVKDVAVFKENGGIIKRFSFVSGVSVHKSAYDTDPMDGPNESVQTGKVGIDEILSFKKIPRRVSCNNQL